MRLNKLIFPVALAIGASALLSAQDVAHPLPTNGYDPNLVVNLPIQKVGPEDLISINVYDSPEFTRTARVNADGTIRMPMLKTNIAVGGLYPNEIEVKITDELKREQLLVDPFVTVNVSEYHSRPVSVMGAVRSPTIFQAVGTGNDTLLDALAKAQGLSDNAGPDIIVTRSNGPDGEKSVQRIPAKPLLSGNQPELNIKLTGGEEIAVPQVLSIVVEGNVQKPGVYPVLDPLSSNTVTTAIAQAGGLAQYADHFAFIFRFDENGVKHQIDVPLWDIIYRKKPDMILQARDILQIPDSPKRRITQTTIQTLSGFGSATTAGVIINRR